jgi:hypothetical protein
LNIYEVYSDNGNCFKGPIKIYLHLKNAPVAQLDRASDYGHSLSFSFTFLSLFPILQYTPTCIHSINWRSKMFIYKRKNGIYYLQFKDEKGIWKKISTHSKSKSEALMFFRTYNHKAAEKKNIVPTISEFSKEYLTYVEAAMSRSSLCNIKYALRYLFNQFGDVLLDEVQELSTEPFIYTEH